MRVLGFLLLWGVLSAHAEDCPTKARVVDGKTIIEPCNLKVEGTLKAGTSYRLVLREAVYRRAPGERPDDGSRWGIDGGFPWTYITDFTLTVGSRRVSLPRKSFSDLVNISRADVSEEGSNILVTVAGGDAAGSFKATFTVRGFRLVDRMVRMGEAPDQRWERTIFHNTL
jgi:hypothetical protein